SSERPSVNVNIKSNSNNKQFQSSKRNKKLQNILPLQKIEIVSKKCICGNALTQMKVIDEKYCNNPVCYNYDNPIKLNKLVWHCKRGQIAEHPQGFDICNHCISKKIDVSKIHSYQTNNLNIDDLKYSKDKVDVNDSINQIEYANQLIKDNNIDKNENNTLNINEVKNDEKAEDELIKTVDTPTIAPSVIDDINTDDINAKDIQNINIEDIKEEYKLDEDEIDTDDIIIQNKQEELKHIFNKVTLQVEDTAELIKYQTEDPLLGNIIFYLNNGTWRDETIDNIIRIQAERGEYIISKNKGILLYKSNRKNNMNQNYRIVIPQKLISNLLDYYHNKYIHNGINKLQFQLRKK